MTAQIDNNWYKPICEKCPYFAKVEVRCEVDEDGELKPVVKCERPMDSACLGENPFIRRFEMINHIKEMTRLNKIMTRLDYRKTMEANSRNARRDTPWRRGKVKRKKIKSSN